MAIRPSKAPDSITETWHVDRSRRVKWVKRWNDIARTFPVNRLKRPFFQTMAWVFYPKRWKVQLYPKPFAYLLGYPLTSRSWVQERRCSTCPMESAKKRKWYQVQTKLQCSRYYFIYTFSRKQCQIDNVILKTHPS